MTCKQQDYPDHFKDEQYNLCKISFDPETGKFGERVDTVFNAVAMGKSLTWPRPSFDGKYILFTLLDYGYFSIWHQESDQWLLDLQTGEARELNEINSDEADSYHSWSSGGNWVVFSSRRIDGRYTRLFLSHFDGEGHFSKPFLLPQEDPDLNQLRLKSYNIPEFITGRVSSQADIAGLFPDAAGTQNLDKEGSR